MDFRVSGRPVQKSVRLSRGEICFHPLLVLTGKILNYSTQGYLVKISFRPEGIFFHNTGEFIPHSQGISKNVFQISSISSITFKPKIKASEKVEAKLRIFFNTGNIEPVRYLIADVTIVPPIDQFVKEGTPIVNLPVQLREIPGTYKHYTNHAGYQGIMAKEMIRARSYGERVARICLTNLSLRPEEAWAILFINDPFYSDHSKGVYVLGFDFRLNARLDRPDPRKDEYWYRGDIKLERDAALRFAGLNPVAYAA